MRESVSVMFVWIICLRVCLCIVWCALCCLFLRVVCYVGFRFGFCICFCVCVTRVVSGASRFGADKIVTFLCECVCVSARPFLISAVLSLSMCVFGVWCVGLCGSHSFRLTFANHCRSIADELCVSSCCVRCCVGVLVCVLGAN